MESTRVARIAGNQQAARPPGPYTDPCGGEACLPQPWQN